MAGIEQERIRAEVLRELAQSLNGPDRPLRGDTPEDQLANALGDRDARQADALTDKVVDRLDITETREKTIGQSISAREAEFAARQELAIDRKVAELDAKRRADMWKNLTATLGLVGVSALGGLTFAWTSLETRVSADAEAAAKSAAAAALAELEETSSLREAALNDAVAAQRAAVAAETRAVDVAVRVESALTRAQELAVEVAAAEDTVRALSDARDAEDFVRAALDSSETLDRLEDRLEPFIVPEDAILAMPASVSYEDCPEGWSLFEPAIGRMILGAGDPDDSPEPDGLRERQAWPSHADEDDDAPTFGGSEKVTLSLAEIPAHRHGLAGISLRSAEHVDWATKPAADVAFFDYRERDGWVRELGTPHEKFGTRPSGGSQPHDNMPPFVSLYWCQKD
ncbi:MAG: hypothetical protein AAFX00_07000 [Pseudomonadota bacterium]